MSILNISNICTISRLFSLAFFLSPLSHADRSEHVCANNVLEKFPLSPIRTIVDWIPNWMSLLNSRPVDLSSAHIYVWHTLYVYVLRMWKKLWCKREKKNARDVFKSFHRINIMYKMNRIKKKKFDRKDGINIIRHMQSKDSSELNKLKSKTATSWCLFFVSPSIALRIVWKLFVMISKSNKILMKFESYANFGIACK